MYTVALQLFTLTDHLGYFHRGEEFYTMSLPAVPMEDNIINAVGELWQVVEVIYRAQVEQFQGKDAHPQIILGVIKYEYQPESSNAMD